jgi:hypothetical protein
MKYTIGETVWLIQNNVVVSNTIVAVAYDGTNYSYNFSFVNNMVSQWLPESSLFASKSDLIASL